MSKTVGEVAIDVTADIGPLVRETNRAKTHLSGLDTSVRNMGKGMQSVGRSTTQLGAKLSIVSGAIAVAAGSAFMLASSAAANGREIDNLARIAGSSPTEFQRMAVAARTVGIEQDKLGDILKDVQDKVGDFITTGGGPMADFFENIAPQVGVTAEEFRKLSGPDALQLYVRSLEKAGVSQAEMTFYMEALASDATALLPILRNNGEEMNRLADRAQELGVILSDDALAASQEFNAGMDDLSRGFEGLRMRIANELLPIFVNKFIPMMTEKVIPALASVVDKVADLIQWFTNLPEPVQEAAAMIGLALGVGGPILVGVGLVMTAIGGLIAATGPIGLLIAAASLLIAAWTIWGDDIKKIVGDAVDFISAKFTAFMDFITGIPEKMKEIGQNIIQGLLDGINERWEALKERIYALAEMLPQWMRDLLEIKSPSQVFAEIGGQIGAGLAEGIAASTDMVRASIADIAGQAVGEADNMVSGVLGAAASLFSGSKKIALAQAAVNVAQGITEALKLPFPANLAAAAKVAAAGAAQIGQIRSANVGSGSVAAPASGAANIPVNNSPAVALQLIGSDNSTFSGGQIRQLITAINEATEGGSIVRLV